LNHLTVPSDMVRLPRGLSPTAWDGSHTIHSRQWHRGERSSVESGRSRGPCRPVDENERWTVAI